MPAPTLVIVPGLWMGLRPYDLLVEELKKKAPSLADVIVAPIKSTGTSSPGNPTMEDDVRGIREVIMPLIEAGKRVVLVCHSAGAFLGGMATKGLEVGEELTTSGGGVERFIFVAGGLLPKGTLLAKKMAPMDVQDGRTYPLDREETLFHDVDPELTARYMAIFECQPAEGWWADECSYTGWEKVPTNYIICENDRAISSYLQEKCAELAGSEILRIPTGHMPQLANPELLAEKVVSCLDLSN